MTTIASTPAAALRDVIAGAVIEPGDADWAGATQAFNAAFVQQPALVAMPEDEADVAAIVTFAAEHGMPVAPQRTGHNADPLGSLDGVILVRTDRLVGVEIDAARQVARVGAGSRWGEVVPRASELDSPRSTARRPTSA